MLRKKNAIEFARDVIFYLFQIKRRLLCQTIIPIAILVLSKPSSLWHRLEPVYTRINKIKQQTLQEKKMPSHVPEQRSEE